MVNAGFDGMGKILLEGDGQVTEEKHGSWSFKDVEFVFSNDNDIFWVDFGGTLVKAGLAPAPTQKIHWLKWAIIFFILEPLINRDLRLRAKGKRADRMHWADALAISWSGFSVVRYWGLDDE